MGQLAELVKKSREERGMSYKKVAEATGGDISNGYVWHIETETVKPADLTIKKLIALARGLDLPVYDVVNAALRDALGGGVVAMPRSSDRVEIIGRASHINEVMELPVLKQRAVAGDVGKKKTLKESK